MSISIIAGSTSIQKKQKQLQELQKERSAAGKKHIQQHNKEDLAEEEELDSNDDRRKLREDVGATFLSGTDNDLELKTKNREKGQHQGNKSSIDENLSISQHNNKVEMELQLKQQKLLEAKKNSDGNKSPRGNRSPIGGRSPTTGQSPNQGGSKAMSNILFSGIDQSRRK